jgi:thioredoxin-like negative regulator of GroEL
MKYLYFTASWCEPCKTLGPIMEKVRNIGINVQKIDVDANNDLISQFGIRNIPTVILVNNSNKEYTRIMGVQSEQKYINTFNEFNLSK